jgi:hypothetical protein
MKRFVLLSGLLATYFLVLSALATGQPNKPTKEKPSPHPWLATAPGEFARLINKGDVSIVVDDEVLKKVGKAGLTRFQHWLDYKCSFDVVAIRPINGVNQVRIRCRYLKRVLLVKHTVYIMSTMQPSDPWQHPLLKHEMDHVAITTDPRLQGLIDGLFSKPIEFDFEWPHTRRPSNQEVSEEIERQTQSRIRDFESFLQIQYDALDELSNHGLEELEDRSRFFGNLYSQEFFQAKQPALATWVTSEELARWSKIAKSKLEAHYIIRL